MKFIILSLFIACASAEFNAYFEDVESFMNSATLATVGEFPSAVFIEAPGVPTHTLCGGTVIDNQHVLTSAQCVLNNQNQLINPFWFTVTAGDNNMINPTSRRQTRRVMRIFVHQNFNPITRNK
jgi:secreted trypsin-like serine protease